MRPILALVLMLAPVAATAERFDVLLGDRVIGSLDSAASSLEAVLDNTPLGLADGHFAAQVDRSGGRADYRSVSEKRTISFSTEAGRVTAVQVDPAGERTALTDPAAVTEVVQDPVSVMALLVGATGCPAPFRMYDGRRVVEAVVTGEERTDATLDCTMDYRVVAGPGHLSPFRFSRVALELTYDLSGGQKLSRLVASAGGFDLELRR